MKKLHVTIRMVMEVPDEWVLEEVYDGISVVNIGGGKYMDLAAEPLITEDKNGTWSNDYDDAFANHILDMCSSEETTYVLTEK